MKKVFGFFCFAQFLLFSSQLMAQGLPAPSYWKNERGSELFIWSSDGGAFQGIFTNHAVGFECQGIPYPASGAAGPKGLYFVVTFAKCNTVTRWIGNTNGSQMPTRWKLFYVDTNGNPSQLTGADTFMRIW